ncbi:hypothetical protein Cgig2_002351 [Carnegiea gigantea]|uniref:Uncharacterized protein n=1 Tax=Carnegiea gigantea TaxID=171969 RepID=A0A9Q1QAB5_9CARY|nr:hypothetical protein Cgig2_002351 [Carnegiea gigantea]
MVNFLPSEDNHLSGLNSRQSSPHVLGILPAEYIEYVTDDPAGTNVPSGNTSSATTCFESSGTEGIFSSTVGFCVTSQKNQLIAADEHEILEINRLISALSQLKHRAEPGVDGSVDPPAHGLVEGPGGELKGSCLPLEKPRVTIRVKDPRSKFLGSHVTVTRPCFRAKKGTAQMHVWYVPPHARRLSAIQSCMRSKFSISPGRLPNKGQTRGPLRRREMKVNQSR